MIPRATNSVSGFVRSLLSCVEAVAIAVAVFYIMYEFLLSHVEGDQAFLLYAAKQVLGGVQLDGPRLIETNPPLIVWFSEIPALLAHLLHTGPIFAFRLVVLLMLLGSASWSARILRLSQLPSRLGAQTTHFLWGMSYFLVLITQPAEFGQREQLLLILFMPYLLTAGGGVSSRLSIIERIALGSAAGLGICFKAHHLLALGALELFVWLYTRSARRLWAPELLAVGATCLLYIAAVQILTPTYLPVVVPLLVSTYWALGQYTLAAMAFHVNVLLTFTILIGGGFWWALRGTLKCPLMAGAFLASASGATLAFFLQHTGWYHQEFPAIALLEAAAVWLVMDALGIKQWHHRSKRVWIGATVCGLVAFAVIIARRQSVKPDKNTITSELARCSPGTVVYAFTVSMGHFPVVLDHDLVWGSRFAHLWMLPAIRANEVAEHPAGRPFHALTTERVTRLATLQRTETTDDLSRTRPTVVFVERCSAVHACGNYFAPFDVIRWFSLDPQFARLWSQYRFERSIIDYDVYEKKN